MRNRSVFDAVKNAPQRGRSINARPKPMPKPKPVSRDLGDWLQPPENVVPAPGTYSGAGQMQSPGTFGIQDMYLGQLYDYASQYFYAPGENPEGVGSMWQSGFNSLNDIYQNYWYQSIANSGYDLNQIHPGMADDIDWDMAQTAWDWWTQYGPQGNYQPFSGSSWPWMGGSEVHPGNEGEHANMTNWQYNWPPSSPHEGTSSTGWSATNPPNWGNYQPTEEQLAAGTGGGNIGGSGDLGTGAWAAGGTAWSTLHGGGLWEYDCATLGPSYNSAGECIACCG
jgi:hypothetical protein